MANNLPMSFTERQRRWLAGGALLLATLLAYAPSLGGPFVWDDGVLITNNPLIHRADGLYRFWCTTEAPDYFPLTSTTWWLEWRLWGDNPLGYRLVNVLLHAASALLLWRVLARLRVPAAWWAGAIFALHPVNVDAVAWIAERKNTLAMVFMLTSVWCYLRAEEPPRQRRWDALALAAFLAALLSKTAVAPLPVALLGLAWWQRGAIRREDVRRSLPFFGLALVFGLITIWFQYNRAIIDAPVRDDGFLSRVAIAGRAVWFYAGKVLWPVNLSAVYPRWALEPTAWWAWLPAGLVVAAVAALGIARRAWLAGFGFFLLMLAPVLGFLNIYFMRYSLVANHWLYFAEIGLVALVAQVHWRVVLVVVLGVLTWHRASLYGEPVRLWEDAQRQNPDSWVVQNNLANALAAAGRDDEALAHYQAAVRIEPRNEKTFYNLGLLYVGRGDLANAIAAYREAQALSPRDADIAYNLGLALGRAGRLAEAAEQFGVAVRVRPGFAAAQFNRGFALAKLGRDAEAVPAFQTAIALAPWEINARYQLAMALARLGDKAGGIRELTAALGIQPDSESLRRALAQLQAAN